MNNHDLTSALPPKECASSPDVLLIFIRNPVPGKVKTRIARTTGDQAAYRIYLQLLEKTRLAAESTPVCRHLYYADEVNTHDDWPENLFTKYAQCDGDLGQRMAHAFQNAFDAGARRVVIIGSDTPEITPDILRRAFQALEGFDLTIGPVPDGGYYLLGMNIFHPELFEGIVWSTHTVRSKTLAIAENLGLSVFTLPILHDIDTEIDWLDYQQRKGIPV